MTRGRDVDRSLTRATVARPAAVAAPVTAGPPVTGPNLRADGQVSRWPMWVIGLVVLMDAVDQSILRGVLEELRREFGLSDPQLGLLASSFVLVGGLVAVPAGYLADRVWRTRTVGYTMFGWAAITALTGAAPGYAALLVCRTALGFGQGINEPTSNSLLADFYPTERRSRAFSLHQVMLVLGTALGLGLGGAVAASLSWRWAFLIVGSPSVLVGFLMLRLKEPRRGMSDRMHVGIGGIEEEAENKRLLDQGVRQFLRDMAAGVRRDFKVVWAIPTLRFTLFGIGTALFAFSAYGTWLAPFYERQLDVDEGTAQGLVGALIFLAGAPGVILGGIVGDRYATRFKGGRMAVPGYCLLASGCPFTLSFVPGLPVAVVFLLQLVAIFALTMVAPILRASVSDCVPAPLRGAAFGAFHLASVVLGMSSGPLVVSLLSSLFDDNLRVAFLIVTPMVLVGAFSLFQARRHYEADAAKALAAVIDDALPEVLAATAAADNGLEAATPAPATERDEPHPTAVLELRGITGGYSAAPVLRSIDLVVEPDEIVGLLGANGAGKTTVLRAISGILPVCSGEVRLDGRVLGRARSWDRVKLGIAHVPEGRHVFGAMTVRENLEVAGLVRRGGVSRDEIFDLFPRMRERQNQLAGSLSGGEQQMLAISRALMTAPRVLVVDEMSAGLAPVMVEQLVAGLVQLRGRDTAVLLVEQSPHFIAGAVDRVYLLEQGAIVGSGSLDELGGADRLAELYLGV